MRFHLVSIRKILSFFTVILFFLVLGRDASAQPVLDTITRKFDRYRKVNLEEKIYVHTDRDFYLTGETLWLKIYLVDASLHRPLGMSKVAYVELLSASSKAVVQAKIEMKDAFGSGSLFLPASIGSGNYVLRAYTSQMKNFDHAFYFQKSITVVNPFLRLDNPGSTPNSGITATFFPEGGSLVNGLRSKVGFHITDRSGKGVAGKGVLVNSRNETVAEFTPLKFGIGSFELTPGMDEYKAVITDSTGGKHSFSFPRASESGYVMSVSERDDQVEVVVSGTPNLAGNTVFLFAHARRMMVKATTKPLLDGSAKFSFFKTALVEGINHFTLFDVNLRPACERLYFKQPVNRLKVDILRDRGEYAARARVTIKLSAAVGPSDLSMSVYKLDSLSRPYQNGILENFFLASDLRGHIQSPEYYMNTSDPQGAVATDNLMLTHGWRRFTWQDVLQNKVYNSNLPEYRYHVIKGIVTDSSNRPARHIRTYLASPSPLIRLYPSVSNEKGEVYYEAKDLVGLRRVIAQTGYRADSTHKFELLNPFSDPPAVVQLPEFKLPPSIGKQLLSRSINMQVQDIYSNGNVRNYNEPADSTAFYGIADETYLLDDFTRFPVMEEVMREYVPGVLVRKTKDKFRFRVLDKVNNLIFHNDPLILVDGVPVFDVDKIMAINPLKIRKLEVMDSRYFLGSTSSQGLVSYSTYTGDLDGLELGLKGTFIDYEGLQYGREFYAPAYDQGSSEDRIPDNRSLLYWNPQIKLESGASSQIEFFTSDIPGKYMVVVEGLTTDGVPGSAVSTFEVTKP